MIKVVFLAQFREKLGVSELAVEPENTPITLEKLKATLASKGDRWREIFECDRILCAVNQEMALPETIINDGDEVAFFPPVTGG